MYISKGHLCQTTKHYSKHPKYRTYHCTRKPIPTSHESKSTIMKPTLFRVNQGLTLELGRLNVYVEDISTNTDLGWRR